MIINLRRKNNTMDFGEIFFTAIGLSMDAFAVSITSGATQKNINMRSIFKICGAFGLFQALMPIMGWLAGTGFEKYVRGYAHWIVFLVLSYLGIAMIVKTIRNGDNNKEINDSNIYPAKDIMNNKTLFVLAVITSLDALSCGVGFAFISTPILKASVLIGVITFIICLIGIVIGKKSLILFKNKTEIFGGVILVLIGLKVLIEHI